MSLKKLFEIAVQHGGSCLSTSYENMRSKYLFRCLNGHEWEARGCNVVEGHWCPKCAFNARQGRTLNAATREKIGSALRLENGLTRLQECAHAKGGVVLSKSYLTARSRYKFRCNANHEWETTGAKIFAGTWCAACAGNKRSATLQEAYEIAAKNGGRCLSQSLEKSSKRLLWMCHHGHQWQAMFKSIRRGTWCPECANANRVSNWSPKMLRRYGFASSKTPDIMDNEN